MDSHTAVAGTHPHALAAPGTQAYHALHVGFTVLPIVAGLDKFFSWFANWGQYLAPAISTVVSRIVTADTFMLIVGTVEIFAGVLVAVKPRIGAYVVVLWLVGIIANLLMLGSYYDIALRDLGLAIGAFALGRLSQEYAR